MNRPRRPFVLGVGGTTRPGSSTERALRTALRSAEESGAETCLLSGPDIDLPNYAPDRAAATPASRRLIAVTRRADAVILASPATGSLSGLVKNALDYLEGLRDDERPYLDGRAVGCSISVAGGWQAAVGTLTALRSVVQALRGWPTPLGVAINSVECAFGPDGTCSDRRVAEQLALVGRQTIEFSTMQCVAKEGFGAKRDGNKPRQPSFIPRQINFEGLDDFG